MIGSRQGIPFNTRCVVLMALSMATMFALSPAAAQICVDPSDQPLGWWPGDGDASDLTGFHDGTLVGGATFAPGIVGQAFSFDGVDSYVKTSINNPFSNDDFANGLTLELWFNTSSPKQSQWLASNENYGQLEIGIQANCCPPFRTSSQARPMEAGTLLLPSQLPM